MQNNKELSPRQIELLELLCKGISNIDIAIIMGIKVQSVAASLQVIYKKLEVKTRSRLIVKYTMMKLEMERLDKLK